MRMKMLGLAFLGFFAIMSAALPVMALDDANDYTRTGTTVYDKGAVLDVKGTLKIDGTQVTATAAQLNAAGGGAVTSGVMPSFTITNLTVVSGLTIPNQSIAAAKIATNSVGAFSVTNISTLSTNILTFNAQGILTGKSLNP